MALAGAGKLASRLIPIATQILCSSTASGTAEGPNRADAWAPRATHVYDAKPPAHQGFSKMDLR